MTKKERALEQEAFLGQTVAGLLNDIGAEVGSPMAKANAAKLISITRNALRLYREKSNMIERGWVITK